MNVQATEDELSQLVEEGYVVRKGLVSPSDLAALRAAADEIEAEELPKHQVDVNAGFGGLFVRNLIDRHKTFRDFCLGFEPTLSVARAVLGPQVQIHASVLRIAYSGLKNQNVEWHFHQRVVPDPIPPFFLRPVVLDNLVYLDELTPETGPLVVLPRSHLVDEDLPSGDHSDKPGQVIVTCPAGSCVTSHSSLWHKALAPAEGSPKRRLLIFGYSPVWLKQIDRPGGGLTDELLSGANRGMRELLGKEGWY